MPIIGEGILEFEEGYKGYFKISQMKQVVRFFKKGRLIFCYVGPYEILQRIGKVSNEFKLSGEFASVQLIFDDSMMKKCVGDPKSILPS